MAPLPKHKISRRRQGKRRAAHKLVLGQLNHCSNCGALIKQHQVCLSCGMYKGEQIIVKKEKKEKEKKKA